MSARDRYIGIRNTAMLLTLVALVSFTTDGDGRSDRDRQRAYAEALRLADTNRNGSTSLKEQVHAWEHMGLEGYVIHDRVEFPYPTEEQVGQLRRAMEK